MVHAYTRWTRIISLLNFCSRNHEDSSRDSVPSLWAASHIPCPNAVVQQLRMESTGSSLRVADALQDNDRSCRIYFDRRSFPSLVDSPGRPHLPAFGPIDNGCSRHHPVSRVPQPPTHCRANQQFFFARSCYSGYPETAASSTHIGFIPACLSLGY